MTNARNTAAIMDPPVQVQALRGVVDAIAEGTEPIVDLLRPYIDGLGNLPRDGRFLLVGNHTNFANEATMIPHVVRREIGTRVRPLADRSLANLPPPLGDLLAAYGAVIGNRDNARELMRHNETMLVFPGGAREVPKFKGESYRLHWQDRFGFAVLSVENNYPIVPSALVGGDDVYQNLLGRDNPIARLATGLTEKLSGRTDIAPAVLVGLGPTLIPRPQRMYLRFGEPIDTAKPAGADADDWVVAIKDKTQQALDAAIADLRELRSRDPYRKLNPLARRRALRPA
jgi:1-acyl-sn-glycerol-3-phosphate acyltransferase